MRQLEAGRHASRSRAPPRALTALLQRHRSSTRGSGRLAARRSAAVRRHASPSRPGPGDSVIAVARALAGEPAFAFQREGNAFVARYRVSLSFQPARARRRWIWRAKRWSGSPPSRRPSAPTRACCSSRSSPGARRLQGDRHRARRRLDLGEPTPRQDYTAPKFGPRQRPARRSWRTRRRGGGARPIRSTWCSTPAAPSATAATPCSPTSRATASPARPRVPFEVRDEQENVDLSRLAPLPRRAARSRAR